MRPGRIRVWDPLVRLGHWTLVASIIGAWLTSEGDHDRHEWIGYVALAVVVFRLVWGVTGPRYARFAQFVHGWRTTLDYGFAVLAHREPRHLGHNPLGAWMILALLGTVLATCLTGVLFTTDRFWGVEWVEELHEGLATTVLVLAALHVAGVVVTSLRHREDLVGAMIHGAKRAPSGDDIA